MPTIGRHSPADIVIPLPQVSALHAEIEHVGGDLFSLRDIGSTNGTYVNGQRITSATIRLDDRISFGTAAVNLAPYRDLIVRPSMPAAAWPDPPREPSMPPQLAGPSRREVYDALPQLPPAQMAQTATAGNSHRQPGMGTELAAALAANRSLVGPAFLTWLLYYLLWLPGLIMNLVYLGEAKRIKNMVGTSPSGTGCLWLLFITHFLLPLIVLVVAIVSGGAVLSNIL